MFDAREHLGGWKASWTWPGRIARTVLRPVVSRISVRRWRGLAPSPYGGSGGHVSPIYLDHHSTTPCDRAVLDAMWPYFAEQPGNAASRSHTYGLAARAAVEHARGQVAGLIGASPKEIIWTSGATEANNLAVLGVAMAHGAGHVVISAIEHKAVLDPADHLRKFGFEVTVIPVDADGRVDPEAVRAALRKETVLVSIMWANNEVGSIQPIAQLGQICRAAGVTFHVDAVQAVGTVPINVTEASVDLLSLSAHKMYGPKGVGALYVRGGRPKVKIEPLLHGGGHERGLRSGTLPVPLAVGMGAAADLALAALTDGTVQRMAQLRNLLLSGLQRNVSGVRVNGGLDYRLPHNLNVSIDDVHAESLMMKLRPYVAVSSGSACSSETLEPSYVLRALGLSKERAYGSIRFGLGRATTAADVDATIQAITEQVDVVRSESHRRYIAPNPANKEA